MTASVSLAQWQLDHGSGLLTTNRTLPGGSFREETVVRSAENSPQPAYASEPIALAAAVPSGSTATTNETTITPEIRALADALGNDPLKILDPAFKEYEDHAPADLKSAMKYDFGTFTNSALAGSSFNADYVKSLNEANELLLTEMDRTISENQLLLLLAGSGKIAQKQKTIFAKAPACLPIHRLKILLPAPELSEWEARLHRLHDQRLLCLSQRSQALRAPQCKPSRAAIQKRNHK